METCTYCGFEYKKDELAYQELQDKYYCEECLKKLLKSIKKEEKIWLTDEELANYVCTVCGHLFKDHDSLQIDLGTLFDCKICDCYEDADEGLFKR